MAGDLDTESCFFPDYLFICLFVSLSQQRMETGYSLATNVATHDPGVCGICVDVDSDDV